MKPEEIIQTVILLLILAFAASCTAGKQYAEKLFSKSSPSVLKDSSQVHFIESDSATADKAEVKIVKNFRDSVITARQVIQPGPQGIRQKKQRDN
jgi:hypothetical protein